MTQDRLPAEEGLRTLARVLAPVEDSADFAVAYRNADRLLAAAWLHVDHAGGIADDPLLETLRTAGPAAAAALARSTVHRLDGDGCHAVAVLDFLAGRLEQAREMGRRARLSGAAPVRAGRLLGALEYALGDLGAAEAEYRAALEADPAHRELPRNLARVLRAQGRFEESEAILRQCLARYPDFAEVHANLLMSFRGRGDPVAEKRHAMELAVATGLSVATRMVAVPSLLFLGEGKSAVRAVRSLLVHGPDMPQPVRLAAWTAWRTGNAAVAARWASRFAALADTAEDWLAVSTLLAGHDPIPALEAARKALRPSSGLDMHLLLRDLCEASGDMAGMVRHDEAAHGMMMASLPRRAGDALRRLRARSHREFFAGHPALRGPEPEPEPSGEAALRRMDPVVHAASARELERDRGFWQGGAFVAGPTDFDVLVVRERRGDGHDVVSAHIVSDDGYVNQRLSNLPSRTAPVTRMMAASPVSGVALPDWVVALDGLPVEEIEGAVFVGGHENHGHFLWETLSRVVAAQCFPELRRLPLCALTQAPYQDEMLSALAGETPVHRLSGEPRILRFRKSYAPCELSYWSATRRIGAAFGTAFGGGGRDGVLPRVFLSRANFRPHRHRIANEDDLRERLERRGFATVQTARLPIAETLRLFAGARIMVGATGAHFSNVPFARPGTRILDLAPRYHALEDVWQWTLPLIFGYAGVHHHRLYGEDVFIEPGTALNWLTRYDPDAVDAALDMMEAEER
ncbi:glycosyltransferase 61 family protein [Azospirillum melinis]